MRLGIEKAHEEKRHIILPRYPPVTTEVRDSDKIPVAILLIADSEFLEVGAIMHIPSEDDGAEPEPVRRNGKELLLRDEFSAEDAIDVYTGHLDHGVVLEDVGDIVDCHRGVVGGHGSGGGGVLETLSKLADLTLLTKDSQSGQE